MRACGWLFTTTRLLLAQPHNIPCILCACRPLREASPLFGDSKAIFQPAEILSDLKVTSIATTAPLLGDAAGVYSDDGTGIITSFSSSPPGGDRKGMLSQQQLKRSKQQREHSAKQQREANRRALESIVKWCAAHQDCRSVEEVRQLAAADEDVLNWVHASLDNLPCRARMILVSMLCEVLYSVSALSGAQSSESSRADVAALSPLQRGLYNALARLGTAIDSHPRMEKEPLPVLMSAIYGLHRVVREGSPVALDAVSQFSLRPPVSMYFAMLRHVEASIDVAATRAASTAGDFQDSAEGVVGSSTLLTMLLVLTPELNAEIVASNDTRVVEQLVKQLLSLVSAQVPNATDFAKVLSTGGANEVAPTQVAMASGSSDASLLHTEHEEFSSLLPSRRSITIGECETIVRNIRCVRPESRLRVLYYLLCVVRDPADLTAAEVERLPAVFHALNLHSFPAHLQLTDYVIRKAPSASATTTAELVPFVLDPLAYVSAQNLLDAAVLTALPRDTSVRLLSCTGLCLPWEAQRQLICVCLHCEYPHLLPPQSSLAMREKGAETSTDEVGQKVHRLVLLTPELCEVLFFILCVALPSVPKPHDTGDSDHSCSHDERERREWLVAVATKVARGVDWSRGVVTTPDAVDTGKSSERANGTPGELSDSSAWTIQQLSLRALAAYTECTTVYGFLAPGTLSDADILNQYARFLFADNSGNDSYAKQWSIVRVAAAAAATLSDEEAKRRLIERVIRFNAQNTAGSSFRFVQLLAPLAAQLRIQDSQQVDILLQKRSLNPTRLKRFFAHSDLSWEKLYAQNVVGAVAFLLASSEWVKSNRVEELRGAVSGWVSRFCKDVMVMRRRTDSKADHIVNAADDTPEAADGTGDQSGNEAELEHEGSGDEADNDGGKDGLEVLDSLNAATERVLVSALHAGCKVTPELQSVVTHHYRTDGEGSIAALPALPAHFVYSVRASGSTAVPLTASYLCALLDASDTGLITSVLGTFLAVSRKQLPSSREPSEDVRYCCEGLGALVRRLTSAGKTGPGGVDEPLHPQSVSTTVLNTVRCVLAHLNRSPAVQQAIGACDTAEVEAGVTRAGACEDEGSAAAITHERQQLVILRAELEGLIISAMRHLSAQHLKDLSLSSLDAIGRAFPAAATALYDELTAQLEGLTQGELLALAARYPPSSPAVQQQLQQHDIHLTIDFNDFLSHAQRLPMDVVELIVRSHLSFLTFGWCTRLLSVLARRHEEIAITLLDDIFSRVCELTDGASDADRNLLLNVLHNYVRFSDEVANELSVPSSTDNSFTVYGAVEPVRVLGEDEKLQRRELVRVCCDKLLLLEGVCDVASLQTFLQAYPSYLQNIMRDAVVAKVEQHVLAPLLSEGDSTKSDAAALLHLVVTLDQHKLLYATTTHRIRLHFFDALNPPCTTGDATDGDSSRDHRHQSPASPETGEARLISRQCGSVVHCTKLAAAMAMAVEEMVPATAHSGAGESRVALDSGVVASDASASMRAVRHAFAALPMQLQMLVALMDVVVGTHATVRSLYAEHVNKSVDELCTDLLIGCAALSASEFAKLMQSISRLRRLALVRNLMDTQQGQCTDAESNGVPFDSVFMAAFTNADAHSRCIVIKALASDSYLFGRYEAFVVRHVVADIPVLAHEDLELLLVATLAISESNLAESLLDLIGTRLLGFLGQCRRSTLVRLMQCHAVLGVHDDALVSQALTQLEEQCELDLKLDVTQIITVLDAIVKLDLPVPEKFVVRCFARLDSTLESIAYRQLAVLAGLAVDLDMGYTSSIHGIVTRLLENRDGHRSGPEYQVAVEKVCRMYDVEAPTNLRAQRLRKFRQRERIAEYWARRSFLAGASLAHS